MTVFPWAVVILTASLSACHETDKAGLSGRPTEATHKTAVDAKPVGVNETKHVNDSLITIQVKTALFADPKASGFQINVNTYRGIVQLSGFVDTLEQKQRAGELAGRIAGVQSVHNDLIVTSGTGFTSAAGAAESSPDFNVNQSSQGDNQ